MPTYSPADIATRRTHAAASLRRYASALASLDLPGASREGFAISLYYAALDAMTRLGDALPTGDDLVRLVAQVRDVEGMRPWCWAAEARPEACTTLRGYADVWEPLPAHVQPAANALALLRTCTATADPAAVLLAYRGEGPWLAPLGIDPIEADLRRRFATLCLTTYAAARTHRPAT